MPTPREFQDTPRQPVEDEPYGSPNKVEEDREWRENSGGPYSPEDSDDQRFGDWQTNVVTAMAVVLIVAAVLVLSYCSKTHAADLFNPDRPEGFAGEGHAANHAHYDGLRNPEGQSCCNGKDCRPTVARFDGSRWWVKVNNVWRDDFSSGKVLNEAWLRSEQARLHQVVEGRWSTEAHVCASADLAYNPSGTKPTIYCVILSDEWN